MIDIIAILLLVSLAAGAVLLNRGRRRPGTWCLGIAALLGVNLAVYGLVRLLSAV